MIPLIRNKYLRRAAVVCGLPLSFLLILLFAVLAPIEKYVRNDLLRDLDEMCGEIRHAWQSAVAAWRDPIV